MEAIILNNLYTVEITGMNHEGQGVGHIDGYTVFVDGVMSGERVKIRLTTVKKSYGKGEVVEIISKSPNRIIPFCSVYEKCGGCSLQHMSYREQLNIKTNMVRETLRRIGGIEGIFVHDTIGMDRPINYRNKAQYPVGVESGKSVIGFYEARSHKIVGGKSCDIQDVLSADVRKAVKQFIDKHKISVYDEESGKGLVRHVMTRTGFKTGEIMVVIVVNGTSLPYANELVEEIISKVSGIKSIILNTNTKNTNVILGEKNIVLYGNGYITDYIGGYKFEISPLSFFQVNPVQTEILYKKALDFAGLTGKETVFDLYCGIGTISLFLSQKAAKVYGVEVVEEAVKDARRNAEINGVTNVEFFTGESEKLLSDIYSREIKADVVIVDPPRKGCEEKLLKTLVEMGPSRIVYVSCNPSTLARDLKYLCSSGKYAAVEAQPVDMFPWTMHVECVVLMCASS